MTEIKTCKLCFIEAVETHENFCPVCCKIIEARGLQKEAYILGRYGTYSGKFINITKYMKANKDA